MILLNILYGMFLLIIVGCSSAQGPLDTNQIYKNDILMTVNGVKYQGTGVISKAQKYNILVETEEKMDLLTISSCHRDVTIENAKKAYTYSYVPNEIEAQGSCTVRVGGYSKNSGKHSWGFLEFEEGPGLIVNLQCNGKLESLSNGVSVCQSHEGLIQRIIFEKPVAIAQKSLIDSCKPQTVDNKVWTYYMPKGECVINFFEVGGKLVHRHTSIGYMSYILREQ